MNKSKNEIFLRQIKAFSEKISAVRASRLALSKVVSDLRVSSPYIIKDGKKDTYIADTVKSLVDTETELENYLKTTIASLFRSLDGFPPEATPVDFVSSAEFRERKLYLASTISNSYCFELDLVTGEISVKDTPLP